MSDRTKCVDQKNGNYSKGIWWGLTGKCFHAFWERILNRFKIEHKHIFEIEYGFYFVIENNWGTITLIHNFGIVGVNSAEERFGRQIKIRWNYDNHTLWGATGIFCMTHLTYHVFHIFLLAFLGTHISIMVYL